MCACIRVSVCARVRVRSAAEIKRLLCNCFSEFFYHTLTPTHARAYPVRGPVGVARDAAASAANRRIAFAGTADRPRPRGRNRRRRRRQSSGGGGVLTEHPRRPRARSRLVTSTRRGITVAPVVVVVRARLRPIVSSSSSSSSSGQYFSCVCFYYRRTYTSIC